MNLSTRLEAHSTRAESLSAVLHDAASSDTQRSVRMNVLVLMPYLYDTVPGQRFRIEQWARVLEPLGVHVEFVAFESPLLKRILHTPAHPAKKAGELLACIARRIRHLAMVDGRWDVIFLYRELLPIGPPLLERWLARKGIPIIYDFDDAIFLSDVSDANRVFRWLKRPQKTGAICRLSTHVIVGNRYLGDYARRYTERVSVIPTTIDTATYAPKASVAIHGRPVIGWSGSLTTAKYLQLVGPALRALRGTHDFRLRVIGRRDFSAPGLEVESEDWQAPVEVERLQSFHIGIMPLPDDAWCRGKCGLKALQYMAVGVPTVASPVGVNADIIQDGQNGFLASSEREWVEKLSRLLADESLRRRFAEEGRKTVESRYAAVVQGARLLDVLEQARAFRQTPATPHGGGA